MLKVEAEFTNEELTALAPSMDAIDRELTQHLTAAEHQPHSKHALAWGAFRKLWTPIRTHLEKIRGRRHG